MSRATGTFSARVPRSQWRPRWLPVRVGLVHGSGVGVCVRVWTRMWGVYALRGWVGSTLYAVALVLVGVLLGWLL